MIFLKRNIDVYALIFLFNLESVITRHDENMYLNFVLYINLQFLQVFDNLDSSNLSKMHKKQAVWHVLQHNRAQHVQVRYNPF